MDEQKLKIFLNRLIDDVDVRTRTSYTPPMRQHVAKELVIAAEELRDSLQPMKETHFVPNDDELNRLVYNIIEAEMNRQAHSSSYRVWLEDRAVVSAALKALYEYVDRVRVEAAANARVSQDENWKPRIDILRKLLVDVNAIIRSAPGWDEDTEWRRTAEKWRSDWRMSFDP